MDDAGSLFVGHDVLVIVVVFDVLTVTLENPRRSERLYCTVII